jgi:hypothetical protein
LSILLPLVAGAWIVDQSRVGWLSDKIPGTELEEAGMAHGVMRKIEELSQERERLVAKEGSHHADTADQARLTQIDHDLQVLWDLRRRELAGERVNLDADFYDRYTVDPGRDAPGR